MLIWDHTGQAVIGTHGWGDTRKCEYSRCVEESWPAAVCAYHRGSLLIHTRHGTLLQDKRDYAGTSYRRNRYYDASTGRFTQEDPMASRAG